MKAKSDAVNDGVMNVSEVARELGVAASTVREWASTGKLPCKRTSSGWRVFSSTAVRELKKAREVA